MQFDVAIIGGGIIGAVTALALSEFCLSVCVLEKESDAAAGASRANSAIIHAGFDAKPGTLKARLNVEGSRQMQKLTGELGVKYRNNGSLVLAFCEEEQAILKSLLARGRGNDVTGLSLLDGAELREREPQVSSEAVGALYAPTGAIVCPYELTVAALGNAMDNGAEFFTEFEVRDIQKQNGGYQVRAHDGRVISASYLVNAAGLYADKIASMAGRGGFHIHPRRGEYLLFDKVCGNLVSHTLFKTPTKMGKGVLVTPTVDGNLLVGPTSEDMTDKEDTATTAAGLTGLLKEAAVSVPALPVSKVITSFSGLRAVGDTGDFIINGAAGFINAAGIESPGLSASPAIARMVVGLLEKEGLILRKKSNFDPVRKSAHFFKGLSVAEKNKVIAQDSSFGRIICRCERVSEGEILEAIRRHPKARTVDAVKRRTRSGMGRCQGGFCTPLIAEILARELKIPLEKVTKSGTGSELNLIRLKQN